MSAVMPKAMIVTVRMVRNKLPLMARNANRMFSKKSILNE